MEWLQAGKLSAYNISTDALALINKSETLKADIRAYQVNDNVAPGQISSKTGAGEFNVYVPATSTSEEAKGYLNIAADRFSTAESTFNILAHELGHFRVEEPGAAIANARANALAGNDKVAYENACNLTEGYAHYNEVKARDEVLANNRAQAAAENRPLTVQEQKLDDRWSGNGVFGNLAEGKDHNTVKGIEDAAGTYGQLLTHANHSSWRRRLKCSHGRAQRMAPSGRSCARWDQAGSERAVTERTATGDMASSTT
ncbi:MAG: hypothetical protein WA159_24665 [Variovorax sp.]